LEAPSESPNERATDPDRFVVSVAFIISNDVHFDMTFPAAGTTRELKIPLPPEFGADPGTTFSVSAYNDGSITGEVGEVDPASRMSARGESPPDS